MSSLLEADMDGGEPGLEGLGRRLIAVGRHTTASIPAQETAMSTLSHGLFGRLARPTAVNCVPRQYASCLRREQLELLQGGVRPPSGPVHRMFGRTFETAKQLTLEGDEQWVVSLRTVLSMVALIAPRPELGTSPNECAAKTSSSPVQNPASASG